MSDFSSGEIPGSITSVKGAGGLKKLRIETSRSCAELYLHGAHLTHFQKNGEAPLLFMSAESEFAPNFPIRGGVPLVFPWFGPREGLASHGFARVMDWTVKESAVLADGSVQLSLSLSPVESYEVELTVTVSDRLSMELAVKNISEHSLVFENCFHTYFHISDIHAISVCGLENVHYLDKLKGQEFLEASSSIHIHEEVDRVYWDTASTVEIKDPGLGRKIRVEKSGGASTVLWNPWIEKAKRMADFGDLEYLKMVCVESGNIGKNSVTLAAGDRVVLKTILSSETLAP